MLLFPDMSIRCRRSHRTTSKVEAKEGSVDEPCVYTVTVTRLSRCGVDSEVSEEKEDADGEEYDEVAAAAAGGGVEEEAAGEEARV